MANERVMEIHRIAKMNHDVLVGRLNSADGGMYIGKWVAVAHGNVYAGTRRADVLGEARATEPDRSRILLTKIPKRSNYSMSF